MTRGMTRGRRRKRHGAAALILLCAAALGLLALTDVLVRPMLGVYGRNQAVTAATRAANDAAERVLEQADITYEQIVAVERDGEGKILSMETDTTVLNRLKAAVSGAVLEELDRQKTQTVEIPAGSLAGGLLTGRGPRIRLKIPMNSTVETTYRNLFEGAGINQTRHEITLEIKMTVYTVIQGESVSSEVTTGFTVAENVLVGEVPQWIAKTS